MPPSLVNIIKELESDADAFRTGRHTENAAHIDGVLVPWAEQGVLLLNTVLTVRAHEAGSHRGKGWEIFTDKVIELIAAREKPVVFILWGANAGAKKDLILRAQAKPRHLIIQAPHPSPLSAYRGFFGGRYFSRSNYFLEDNGIEPVDWTLRKHSGQTNA
jgi:uracil-DNA glycosylase